MNEGDVIGMKMPDGAFSIKKILKIDVHPVMGATFHCKDYELVTQLRSREDVARLRVVCQHAPINGASIEKEFKVLFNEPVRKEELGGFFLYLKEMDFPRYTKESGIDVNAMLDEANMHYRQGCALAEARKFREAIDAYSEAIEIFPLLFEAIDNRGLAHMDLGEWDQAIADFKYSLSKNPDGQCAFFSLGECYLKKGEVDEAAKIFAEGNKRWPKNKMFGQFLKAINKAKCPGKPWWKIW